MQDRCRNPKNPRYADYGGRGITVHPWWEDFIHFKMDMGDRPPGTSIDRWPNHNGNYEPGNCRWASPKEQQRNRRANHYVEYKGQRKLIGDWATELGLNYEVLRTRLRRHWSLERAMTTPIALNQYAFGRRKVA